MRRHLCAFCAVAASLTLAVFGVAHRGLAAEVEATETPAPAARINPTGRTYEIEVPVKLDDDLLGNVLMKITSDEKIYVDAKLLETYLGKVFRPEILAGALGEAKDTGEVAEGISVAAKKKPGAASSAITQALSQAEAENKEDPAEPSPRYVLLDLLKQRGIDMRFDPLAIELQVLPALEQRAPATLSFAQQSEVESEALEPPASVSAYLNIHVTAGYVSQSSSGRTGFDAAQLDLDGAARFKGAVFETEGSLYASPSGVSGRLSYEDYVFYRRATRIVYDLPEHALRLRAGDIAPDYAGFQTAPNVFGLSVQHSYSLLQPEKDIRPTGAHSFRIERTSEIDIIIDAVLFRHIRLTPGNYDLSDLPLRPGANKIKLEIADDSGAHRTLEFTAFSGGELLAPNISEWSVTAGVKSYDQGVRLQTAATETSDAANATVVNKRAAYQQRTYYFDNPAVTGFYRTGLTTAVTVTLNAQADNSVAMTGAGFVAQSFAGVFSGELAQSTVYGSGTSYALRLGYSYDKLKLFGLNSVIRLFSEYRNNSFETIEISKPLSAYNESVGLSYSQLLPYNITAGLSARFSHMERAAFSNDLSAGSRLEADFSLAAQLLPELNGSLSVGYSRDDTEGSQTWRQQNGDGFQALARLSWYPQARTQLMSSYDSHAKVGTVGAAWASETRGPGAWSATVDAQTASSQQETVNASLDYQANRGTVSIAHAASLVNPSSGGLSLPSSTEQRTAISAASSLVYADGAFGVGRPVAGAFALVTPHESLEGSPVIVGPPGRAVAESDWLGPAVIPGLDLYKTQRLPYDAPDAPKGYDLGRATFDMNAPYGAGYALKVGSDYTVTSIGTLLDAEGQPVALLAGAAREADKKNGRKVELFTNRSGRFGAQGLAPGKWIIEMPGDPEPSRYVLEIPHGVKGLYNAGALKPQSAGEPKSSPAATENDNATN